MEHIVLADALLFETAVKSLDGAANAKWEGLLNKTDLIKKRFRIARAKSMRRQRFDRNRR